MRCIATTAGDSTEETSREPRKREYWVSVVQVEVGVVVLRLPPAYMLPYGRLCPIDYAWSERLVLLDDT